MLFFRDLEGTGELKPFLEGAFQLDGPTGKVASIMPYYTVSWDVDKTDGENVGNSNIVPILEAYELGCKKYGEAFMRQRFEQSAKRLLRNMFQCGLFENPYLKPAESQQIVGSKEYRDAGFQAQLKSVVMLKNNDILPMKERVKVYVPNRHINSKKNFFRMMDSEMNLPGANKAIIEQYYEWVETPEEADAALVFVESPISDGYSTKDRENGGNGYVPLTLQYRPYTAKNARSCSIAGGDPREDFTNRSYKDKTNTAANEADLDIVIQTKKQLGDKPVVVVVRMHHPMVMAEIEPYADAILVDFGVEQRAICEIVSGKAEPQGLLPVQLPIDMDEVEAHFEDRPLDMRPYLDTKGNAYDFGFGLNWSGVIEDERKAKYTCLPSKKML